MHKCRSPFRR